MIDYPSPQALAEDRAATRGAWTTLIVMALATLVAFTDRQILSLLVEPIKADLGLTETNFGVVQGLAFAIAYGVGAILMGRLADLFNRRNLMCCGVALWTLATVGCGYSHTFHALFVNRVLVGIGEAALVPVAISMISDGFPSHRRGLAIGLYWMSLTIGIACAVTIGGILVQAAQSGAFHSIPFVKSLVPWRASLVILALPGAVILALLAFVREPERRGGTATHRGVLPKVTAAEWATIRSVALPLCVGMSLVSVGEYTSMSWVPSLLMRVYSWTPGDVATGFGVFAAVAGGCGSLVGGFCGDRFALAKGTKGRIIVGCVAGAGPIIGSFIGFVHSAPMAVAMVCCLELSSAAAVASCTAAVQEVVPATIRSLAVALTSFGSVVLGMGFGVVFAAVLTDDYYRSPAAVGISISTIVIPFSLLAFASFAVSLRNANRDRVRLTPDFIEVR